ncbi:uncharacterized protein ACLA_095990 [Aspergillus clavatus NRRL 1]|uniref:Tyrosyl-DNA phosphodiesterase domain protein n=1 Tax=Aspergillus clavatus (strain ATCC 1007 / CBS 513.65 / DSM 816 / NCTC 3887 / NRRL 1 / QM 1276 / 107) TaxID=344612 RepID=A1CM79_ASPCL|nr:tyrosyl-DNA phosphodiesterase domain protein [Aspergillus clavatus NRRL 1]EAW08666.1 tyrosyl-DNA phosphodiesterase domain protein [Aspergillus clavatus NRRL 1]
MGSEDLTDPDLRAAIEASLRDVQGPGAHSTNERQQDVVDLTADSDDDDDDELLPVNPKSKSVISSKMESSEASDDEDLKRAIELSLQQSEDIEEAPSDARNSRVGDNKESTQPDKKEISTAEVRPSQSSGILGLNRKQMEEERLVRMAKRKAEDTGSVDLRQVKHSKTESSSSVRPSDTKIFSTASIAKHAVPPKNTTPPAARQLQSLQPSRKPGVQFPKGIVKKTHAQYCPRMGDDITIEEVFQKDDLELAVLSSFIWDMEWFFSKLDTKHSRFLLVMQAKDDATKRQYEAETASMRNLRLCFPPMDGQINCMHSKLMLLFHPEYLRIVVPTANLTPYDWGEMGGVMENSAFLIDLPRKSSTLSSSDSKTAFLEDLVFFLSASRLHENVIAKLGDYDFRETKHIMLVHTIGGSHIENFSKTGFCGLGRAVKALGLSTFKSISIDYVTSSVGSLTDEFLRSIYLACQGDDGMTEHALRTTKTMPARPPTTTSSILLKPAAEECKDRFRVYFPSQTTVEQSRGGPNCAGTICFQQRWYEGPKFPKHLLRDCKSRRPGLLMHNKMLFVTPDEPITLPDTSQCQGWAYVGSANLSESAWGRLVQDRATKRPKLNCRNWECGVLIPVRAEATAENRPKESESKPVDGLDKPGEGEVERMLDTFKDTVPVPMRVPGQRYGPGLKPWFF